MAGCSEGDEGMFWVGQKVWSCNGKYSGTVLECDGGRVFIAQDNGAELDFRESDLSATPPGEGAGAKLRESLAATGSGGFGPNAFGPVPARALTPGEITPEHARVLEVVPLRTVRAVAALFERRPKAGRFSALDVAGKLNVIAEVTAVPYRTMREYRDRPGELGLLMGKGLADSSSKAG